MELNVLPDSFLHVLLHVSRPQSSNTSPGKSGCGEGPAPPTQSAAPCRWGRHSEFGSRPSHGPRGPGRTSAAVEGALKDLEGHHLSQRPPDGHRTVRLPRASQVNGSRGLEELPATGTWTESGVQALGSGVGGGGGIWGRAGLPTLGKGLSCKPAQVRGGGRMGGMSPSRGQNPFWEPQQGGLCVTGCLALGLTLKPPVTFPEDNKSELDLGQGGEGPAVGLARRPHPCSPAARSPVTHTPWPQDSPVQPHRNPSQCPRCRCPAPPHPLQPPGHLDRKEGTYWAPRGFPAAPAGAPGSGQPGREGAPGAAAAPGEQRQVWLCFVPEQWLPLGVPGWVSPALRRARPSSPAPPLAWAGASRGRLARAPRVPGPRQVTLRCWMPSPQETEHCQERQKRWAVPY